MIVRLDDSPDVVAVIPTLGRELERLKKCLESIHQSSFDGRLAMLVVWNDPRRQVPDLGQVTVVEPGLNLGFPIALNTAREMVSAPLLWIVQDDQTVEGDCLQVLADRMAHTDRPGIVSPVIINEDGRIPANSRGGILRENGVMDQWYPFSDVSPEELDRDLHLDWVTLSGALVRCEAWDEVGGMDPMFFPLLWSDVDLGCRMTKIGIPVILEPTARVSHERNGSTPSLLAHFLSDRNRGYFDAKHGGDRASEERPSAGATQRAIDPVGLIAREASLLLIDFARHVEPIVRAMRTELDGAAEAISHYEHELESERVSHQRDRHQLEQATVDVERLQSQIEELRNSRSMRLTRPLRALSTRLRRIRQE